MEKGFNDQTITPFGATNFRNEKRVFGIKADDRRRHMYIIGKTGMGKSTLLENLVYSDIQYGHGVAYVDPHGDTAEKILQWIPEHRVKDVIYVNPSDLDNPIAFNVLEKVAPEYRNLVASGLVSVYKKLWADSWGPRLEYILRYCILALLDSPESTLLGINRMLVDKKYRDLVVGRVADPVVRAFWQDEFSKWNERVIAEVISPIQNKVGQFLSNSMIRNIVGQLESTINLREIMDNQKILILNLSKGRMGEDASALLGAMIITKIQLAAMSRVDMPEDDRKDFYLYVDEFQNFATESFATILSEARKYRLCLTMAHQYIAQLEDGGNTVVRDAVFGNVGTIITFRVGATDAEFLEKEYAPKFTVEDIVNLPKFQIYLRLMVDGIATEPFSANALPPLASKDFGHSQQVIEYTRQNYAKKKVDVENIINSWQLAEGGLVNPNPQIASSTDFDNSKPGVVLERYEALKRSENQKPARFEGNKEPSRENKYKEEKPKDDRPVVWSGPCDMCGRKIDLKFEPDSSRPILCQDDLKAFRKGSLTGEQVEKIMEKVFIRKGDRNKSASSDRNRTDDSSRKNSRDNKKPEFKPRDQVTKDIIPVIPGTESKGRIRIVKDEPKDISAPTPAPVIKQAMKTEAAPIVQKQEEIHTHSHSTTPDSKPKFKPRLVIGPSIVKEEKKSPEVTDKKEDFQSLSPNQKVEF